MQGSDLDDSLNDSLDSSVASAAGGNGGGAAGRRGGALAAARTKLLTKIMKKNTIENIVPIVIALKRQLEASHSPLLRDLMSYVTVLLYETPFRVCPSVHLPFSCPDFPVVVDLLRSWLAVSTIRDRIN